MSSSRRICKPVITSLSSRSFSSMLPLADAAAATNDAILATLRSPIRSDTIFSLEEKEEDCTNKDKIGKTDL